MRTFLLISILFFPGFYTILNAQGPDSEESQNLGLYTRFINSYNQQTTRYLQLNDEIMMLREAGKLDGEIMKKIKNLRTKFANGKLPASLFVFNDLEEYYKIDSLLVDFFRFNSRQFNKNDSQLKEIKEKHPYLYKRISNFTSTKFPFSQTFFFRLNSPSILSNFGTSLEIKYDLGEYFNLFLGADIGYFTFMDKLESDLFDQDFSLQVSNFNFELYNGIGYLTPQLIKQNASFFPDEVTFGYSIPFIKTRGATLLNTELEIFENFSDFNYHQGKFWFRIGLKYYLFNDFIKRKGFKRKYNIELVVKIPLLKENKKFTNNNIEIIDRYQINIDPLKLRNEPIVEIKITYPIFRMIGTVFNFRKNQTKKIKNLDISYNANPDSIRLLLSPKFMKKQKKQNRKLQKDLFKKYKQAIGQSFDMTRFHQLNSDMIRRTFYDFQTLLSKRNNEISKLEKKGIVDDKKRKELEDITIDAASLISYHLSIDIPNRSTFANYPSILSRAGWLKILREDFIGAEKFIKEGLSLDKNSEYLKMNLAHALILQGKYDEAKVQYQRLKNRPLLNVPNHNFYKTVFLEDLYLFQSKNIIPDEYKNDVMEIIDLMNQE